MINLTKTTTAAAAVAVAANIWQRAPIVGRVQGEAVQPLAAAGFCVWRSAFGVSCGWPMEATQSNPILSVISGSATFRREMQQPFLHQPFIG